MNTIRPGPRHQMMFLRKCVCGASYWQVGPVLAVCPWKLRHPAEKA